MENDISHIRTERLRVIYKDLVSFYSLWRLDEIQEDIDSIDRIVKDRPSEVQTISVFANKIGPNPAIEARADIIEWRYKLENGRVYKRRYKYTKQKAIGDWIPA